MQGRTATTPDVVGENRLRLKEKEEYFCCLGLRERHNSLSNIDGPVESRKFVMEFGRGHFGLKVCGAGRGQRWLKI
jgi:hypothetical protein